MDDKTIKLQKYIADCGLMSRRAAEEVIKQDRLTVNGQTAKLGDRVEPGRDEVLLDGEPIGVIKEKKLYIALNKPVGYVTTMSDEQGRKCVGDLLSVFSERLYPVGRLDINSEGLIICTNDGEFANRLMHPSHGKQKIYNVVIKGNISNSQIDKLRCMKTLDDEPIACVEAEIIDRNDTKSRLKIILRQGKNRQIRRMCEACGLYVTGLTRIAVGNVRLGDLPVGSFRHLTREQIADLKK